MHAQPIHADGYCFLNNAGLAIKLALKIVTIDIDVHYGKLVMVLQRGFMIQMMYQRFHCT
jgi:acetoin utilization deacetylase AcuC-like enzyme